MLDTLYLDTLRDGGATVNVRTGVRLIPGTMSTAWADAYAVGGSIPSIVVDAADPDAFAAAIASLTGRAEFLGTWLDAGSIHVDAVDIVWDLDEAVRLGTARGELAIFNLGTAETVRLDAAA